MTDVYKQVVCLFIQEGALTLEQVQEKVKTVQSLSIQKSRQTPTWAHAKALCERLATGIAANSYRSFQMNLTNVGSMEKLIRLDKVSVEEAEEMVDWCLKDEFWSSVILSPAKFRKHYLTMKARRASVAGQKPVIIRPEIQLINGVDKDFYEQKRTEHAESVPMPKDFKRIIGLGN